MMYAILFLVAFVAGVLCAGYVVAVVGGIRTDIALLKAKALNLEAKVTGTIESDIDALKAKLP